MESYAAAETDATHALAVDPKHIKALHRRGLARRALGQLQRALDDLQTVLHALPGNAQLLAEIAGVRTELANAAPAVSAAPPATPAPASSRTRLVVEEESDDEEEAQSAAPEPAVEHAASPPMSPPTPAPPATPASSRTRLVEEEESDDEEEAQSGTPIRAWGAARARGKRGAQPRLRGASAAPAATAAPPATLRGASAAPAATAAPPATLRGASAAPAATAAPPATLRGASAAAAATAAPPATPATRTRLVVVEEDSDEEEETSAAPGPAAQPTADETELSARVRCPALHLRGFTGARYSVGIHTGKSSLNRLCIEFYRVCPLTPGINLHLCRFSCHPSDSASPASRYTPRGYNTSKRCWSAPLVGGPAGSCPPHWPICSCWRPWRLRAATFNTRWRSWLPPPNS
jgi:hypothetical protein